MASFEVLPSEIKVEILRLTLGPDFEALALTCRGFYQLAKDFFASEHEEYKQLYGTLEVYITWNRMDSSITFSNGSGRLVSMLSISLLPFFQIY